MLNTVKQGKLDLIGNSDRGKKIFACRKISRISRYSRKFPACEYLLLYSKCPLMTHFLEILRPLHRLVRMERPPDPNLCHLPLTREKEGLHFFYNSKVSSAVEVGTACRQGSVLKIKPICPFETSSKASRWATQ